MLNASLPLLWIPITLLASVGQTARNAMQRSLTATIGTVGATQVRFLYGFPFSLVFLAAVVAATGAAPPAPGPRFLAFMAGGAVAQIIGTALMLAAMRERSFAVATAYLKTEPVQVAVFGVLVLGDHVSLLTAVAVITATVGVVLTALKPGGGGAPGSGARAAALGIAAGAFFALSAVGFRGAIVSLGDASFVLRATTTLVWALGLQTVLLAVWLGLFDRPALTKSLVYWRPSLFAGFVGALASQFWFIGFALTTAANVRTLALVEVLFAQIVSRRLFDQRSSPRELAGIALVVAGVALLLMAQA